jgi:parvulin-like peptidyl-prolyl isomerase
MGIIWTMYTPRQFSIISIFFLLLLALLAACAPTAPTVPATDATPTPFPPSPGTPSATPVPSAFTVNGEIFPLEEFDAEVARYLAAQSELGNSLSQQQAEEAVRADLTAQMLLAQGAARNGFSVDEADLTARIASLAEQIGGQEALVAWQTGYGYSEQSFRTALKRQIAAAYMRDAIAASIPTSAEQVHVRQILLYNRADAESVLVSLQSGREFAALAAAYDPQTRGEMGWFPRGYLFEPAVEAAAFALQPGETSVIVESGVGFHILQVIAREANRPLAPDALRVLQTRAVENWVKEQMSQAIP